MDCRDLGTLLHPYVDGEFDEAERAEVEGHLAACGACRAEVEAQRAYKRTVRAASDRPAPSGLRGRIAAALDAEEAPVPLRPAEPKARSRGWKLPAAAAVAAGLAAGVAVYVLNGEDGRAELLVADAVAAHSRSLPLEVQEADLPRIRSWFEGKVDFAPSRIPQLRKANLLGARLSHLSDRQAAYVSFGTPQQRRVSLFVFGAPDLRLSGARRIDDREVLIANQRGYNVALWKDHEIAYSLVTDLDEQDVLELVANTGR